MSNYEGGRPARKQAQSLISEASSPYSGGIEGKKATKAVAEAKDLLSGRSGLSTQEKVERLTGARDALKVAVGSSKVSDGAKEKLEEARKQLKKAVKAYK